MKKALVIALLVSMAAWNAAAQRSEPCVLFDASYGERLPGSSADVALWWASSGWKVSRERPAPKRKGKAVQISAACNEAEAAQLVVRPSRALNGFRAEAGALASPDGATIPAEQVDVLRVRYVDVARQTDSAGAVGFWPDPLPPFKGPITIEADTNQPLWVRVHVPKGTPPGEYAGAIRLAAEGYAAEIPLHVTVYGFELPDRMTCTSAFGFSPGNVYSYQNISDAAQRREVIAKYWENFRAHHISPYNPAPFDPFSVEWVTRSEEDVQELPEADRELLTANALTPVFDWSAWDAALTHAFETYHFNSIRFTIPGLGGGSFYGKSAPSLGGFREDTRAYQLALNAYCHALQEHLREKGWLDEAYIYWFDEPAPKDYPYVLKGFEKLIKAAPDLNRMITERVADGLIGGPNIWCPVTLKYRHEDTEARRKLGEIFWWYVCTVPKRPYPGLFIDRPATDLRVWLWQTWKYDIKGILVWQTNLWTTGTAYPDAPQNPYEDSMAWMSGYGTKKGDKKPWGNGDGRFIYPPEIAATPLEGGTCLDGPVDSIRWEMLRDGIEDYEYMVILERLLEERKATLAASKHKRFRKLLNVPDSIARDVKTHTSDPAPIERHRHRVARAIEALQRLSGKTGD